MKKSEIATIILIASVSIMFAYVITQSALAGVKNQNTKVKTIESIDSAFQVPSDTIFNSKAINPTVEVQITNNGS